MQNCFLFPERVWELKVKSWVYSQHQRDLPTQLSHRLQCEALGGLKILQVKQYFSLTVWPLISTSLVLGGGRELVPLTPLAASVNHRENTATERVLTLIHLNGSVWVLYWRISSEVSSENEIWILNELQLKDYVLKIKQLLEKVHQ